MNDKLEFRSPEVRDGAQFAVLQAQLRIAQAEAPGWRKRFAGVDTAGVTRPGTLSRLPLLRKSDLTALQSADPPFGGLALKAVGGEDGFSHVFVSPGPIFEPGIAGSDTWRFARALRASGFVSGDLVLNGFSYHMSPAGAMLEAGLREVGAGVIPGGTGNTAMQAQVAASLKPTGFVGTPDFLKAILDKGAEEGLDLRCFRRMLVTGGALFPSLREFYEERGIRCRQCYGTADVGLIAYESDALDGMIVDEHVILEIVRPGTGDPVPDGEVGEVVVSVLSPVYPLFRFATGDLSAILPGDSPCGRTAPRIRGWLGRADQSTKIRGLFVHASQVASVQRQVPEMRRLRAVVTRSDERDELSLQCECDAGAPAGLAERIADVARSEFRMRCDVEIVAVGSLPNDGRVIADEREYGGEPG